MYPKYRAAFFVPCARTLPLHMQPSRLPPSAERVWRLMFKLDNKWLWIIGFSVFFPVSFQLTVGIYRDQVALLDTGGLLATVPLPLSLLSFVPIIALWPKHLDRVYPALATILGMCAVCAISLLAGSDGATPPNRKLITSIQIILPLMGLLLGQLVGDDKNKIIARAFMVTISIVVPWQLLASWLQHDPLSNDKLTHYLFVFSIYAHRQYVTLIFVCAFAYSMVSLWQEYKRWFCILSALMLVYVSISLSYLTIFAYFGFLLIFMMNRIWTYRLNMRVVLLSLLAFSLVTWGGYAYLEKETQYRPAIATVQYVFHGKFDELLSGQVPTNVQTRIDIWKLFTREILSSYRTLLVGHPQPMPREMKANPHNGYLDVAYSFGLIGLLPIVALIIYTGYLCLRQRNTIFEPTWWLLAIVAYIVLVDNNFKSTLRQPYPSIFAYFLWGMLLQHMRFGQQTTTPSKVTAI